MVHHRLLSLALSLQLLLLVCLALPSISSFPTTGDEFVPASFAFVQTSNTTTERDVSKIVESIKTFEGAGFPVERCLPDALLDIICF
jgi:ABC-type oligopeptide transport system substrate-binding subunit